MYKYEVQSRKNIQLTQDNISENCVTVTVNFNTKPRERLSEIHCKIGDSVRRNTCIKNFNLKFAQPYGKFTLY